MIQDQKSEGIKVHMPPPGSPEEQQYDPTKDTMMELFKVFIAFL